jgi:hypothetical protein
MLDQTQAEMTDASAPGQNIDDGKLTTAKIMARVRELGKAEGKGDNSRPGIFLVTVEGAKRRAIVKDDVQKIFAEYDKASAAARGVGWKQQASEKQQVSKLAVAFRLGELPHVDGMILMEKVIAFQKDQRIAKDGKMDYSPFDGMVRVARYQVTKSPTQMLSDEVVQGLLLKGDAGLPEEADRLDRVRKEADKLLNAKDAPVSEETAAVLVKVSAMLADQVAALGGTTAQRKADAADRAEAAALVDLARAAASRTGISLVAA